MTGESTTSACPACGATTFTSDAFCRQCGLALAGHAGADEPAPGWSDLGGERRQLTVMFCDLVGSTPLTERLDPEELQPVLAAYQDACSRVINKFEGHVAQYRGDGLLVYFSYPQAHEDDAERAVKAGLEIVAAIQELNPRLERERGAHLQVRIGVHTGPVLVGEVGEPGRREAVALGHTVNVAARLQEIAEPDSVVMSDATLRLVRGLFITADRASFNLKGIASPVSAQRVVGRSGVRSRLDVSVSADLTPLVGREQDLAALVDGWDRVCRGEGQVILIGGDAGIGKSRLVRSLRDRLASEPHTWLECRGSPHHRNSALHPLIDLMRHSLRFDAGSPELDLGWLESSVEMVGLERERVVPLFASMLSIDLPERYAPLTLDAEAQRRLTLEALVEWLFALAKLQPLVFVVEDLHWTDASSQELLSRAIERVAGSPILLVVTYRPTFEPRWSDRPNLKRLDVEPLTRRQTLAMIDHVSGEPTLPDSLREQLVSKTDGVPLFIEELTRGVMEGSSQSGIPSTLKDSLMSRLDRLGPVKELAQLAAVLGREFSHEHLLAVSGGGAPALEPALERLRDAGVVYPRGTSPETSYIFKHALIQEAAYQSLRKETRRTLHARIARILEERFPEYVESEPETIARHSEAGGLLEKAIRYHQRAGELAREESANVEATGHFARAIELLQGLPASLERDERELLLQMALGSAIGSSLGWGASEAEESYERARELCENLGETPRLFQAVRGLIAFYNARARLDISLELSRRLQRLAQQSGDSSELLLADHHMGVVNFYRGRQAVAVEHLEAAIERYEPAVHRPLASIYQADPGVFSRVFGSLALSAAGFPMRGLRRSSEAIEMAAETSHPFSLAYALTWGGTLHMILREYPSALKLARAAIWLSEEHHFDAFAAGGRVTEALIRMDPDISDGDTDAAFSDLRRALASVAPQAMEVQRPIVFGPLAGALLRLGRAEQALGAADGGLASSREHASHYWDAELFRLRGEALLQLGGDPNEAEDCLRRAVEIAREQEARLLGLRAGVSLCRRTAGGAEGEDGKALRELLCSFDEGFELADLREARALLEGAG